MPYLRVTCPPLSLDRRRAVAQRLTQAVNDLFYHPRGRLSRDELRARTTVHFALYGEADLFIGGRTPEERGAADITVELSDWGLSVRKQRQAARALTAVLAELFAEPPRGLDGINVRFHPYPPTDFAVGGRLLSDLVPRVARLMKWLFS